MTTSISQPEDDKTTENSENQTEQKNKPLIDRIWDFIKKPPQWFSAIFAGMALIISSLMYNSTRKQINIAGQNLEVAKKSMEFSNKAWIGFETVTMDTSKAESLTVIFKMKNFGKSPAFKLITGVRTNVQTDPNIDPWTEEPIMQNPFDLMPDGNINFTQNTKNLGASNTRHIINGRLILYVYGRVEYYDIFDKRYLINFCWRYIPRSIRFTTHHIHNEYKQVYP